MSVRANIISGCVMTQPEREKNSLHNKQGTNTIKK